STTPPTQSGGDQNTGTTTGTGNLASTILDPEETTSFEVGAKALLFRNRLSVSAAAFTLTRENAAVQIANGVFAQVGEARVSGLELGINGEIAPGWTVFGGYTFQDSELVRGTYNSANIGDPLANTPEHSFSLFTTYEVTPKLSLGGGVYHVSDSFGGNQGGAGGGANFVFAPAYTRYDAYASYEISPRWAVQMNIQNLTDEDYIARTNGVHHADYGPARQAILSLNARF
ncbi:MAG TPA: TonB-dependent receptor, partial [Caulobacteraceae bacterium]